MNLLKLSWKNLVFQPLNLLLVVVLFALGVGLVSFLLNINQQLEENFNKNLAGIDLVIGAKGSPLQLILSSMYHVDNPTGNVSIQSAKPFLNPRHPLIARAVPLSLGDSYRSFRIVGTTYDILQLYGARLAQGRLWKADMEVVVGAAAADRLHLHIGDTFKSSHGLVEGIEEHEHDFRVVGILAPTGSVIDQLILTNTSSIWLSHEHENSMAADSLIHAEHAGHAHDHDQAHAHEVVEAEMPDSLTLQQMAEEQRLELMSHPEKQITSILITFRSRTNIQALNMGRNINENTDLMAASPPNEIARLQTTMGQGASTLQWLAWVIVFVSGLSVFISLYASLKERRYELALVRVMGGTRRTLFVLIVLEGLLLSLLGYVAGMVVSHAGLGVVAHLLEQSYRYTFTGLKFLPEEGWLLVGSLLVGLLAALIPAWQARNTDISETLARG